MSWQPHNDAYSQAVFAKFEGALRPTLAKVAPDWLLHHIKMDRRMDESLNEVVEIRLVIKPIGEVREACGPAGDGDGSSQRLMIPGG